MILATLASQMGRKDSQRLSKYKGNHCRSSAVSGGPSLGKFRKGIWQAGNSQASRTVSRGGERTWEAVHREETGCGGEAQRSLGFRPGPRVLRLTVFIQDRDRDCMVPTNDDQNISLRANITSVLVTVPPTAHPTKAIRKESLFRLTA